MIRPFILCIFITLSASMEDFDRTMHPFPGIRKNVPITETTEDAEFWAQSAQDSLTQRLQIKHIEKQANNVIFFLGDGMSVPTITAARMLKGEKVDKLPLADRGELYMDSFPNIGVSKTFCSDSRIADSACSASAYLSGSKANTATIGVKPSVSLLHCAAQANKENHLESIIEWAQAAGKSTGVVTTTRITHASPAGAFAHVAFRDWENDAVVRAMGADPTVCEDIAAQMILREPGNKIDVILGGGRLQFLPNTERDPETDERGYRLDGNNLIQTWINNKNSSSKSAAYITGRDQLLNINTAEVDQLLGLFAPSHLGYLDEQLKDNDPSLEEMTRIAIEILKKNPNGFFLFVEGGRIDHAHHFNNAQRALWETIEFDNAIKHSDIVMDEQDTLIVVTSDHAHVMSIPGYPWNGSPVMGIAGRGIDFLPFGSLGYLNGPGYRPYVNGIRPDITNDDFESITYQLPTAVPLLSETHGGDDVLIFSKGPFSHLLTGVQQQSYIPHVIAYAACVGKRARFCDTQSEITEATTTNSEETSEFNGSQEIKLSRFMAILSLLFVFNLLQQ